MSLIAIYRLHQLQLLNCMSCKSTKKLILSVHVSCNTYYYSYYGTINSNKKKMYSDDYKTPLLIELNCPSTDLSITDLSITDLSIPEKISSSDPPLVISELTILDQPPILWNSSILGTSYLCQSLGIIGQNVQLTDTEQATVNDQCMASSFNPLLNVDWLHYTNFVAFASFYWTHRNKIFNIRISKCYQQYYILPYFKLISL